MKSRVTLLEKDNAPDLIRGSDPNRSMASINELSDYTETARYNVRILLLALSAISVI